MKIKLRLAAITFYINRFNALSRAERLFNIIKPEPGTLMQRQLFGRRYVCDVSRWPQQAIFLIGERYLSEAILVQQLLKPGMRVVDVGANVGYYLLMFARKVGSSGHIVAIEPSPENLPELQLNVERNGLRNVQVIAKAVGSDRRVVGLRRGINSGVVVDGSGQYKVDQESLDNLVTGAVDLVKIDIEGYEGQALRGAVRLIEKYRPILFVEVHPEHLKALASTASEVIRQLNEYYNTIELFRSFVPNGFIRKFAAYYLGASRIEQIRDTSAYIEQCDEGGIRETFWAICRQAPRNSTVRTS